MSVDLLAVAAHRDDVELTCAGTLIRAADAGYRTGILDLTAGESGTRGSAALRGEEAERAARIMGVAERRNGGLPDAHIQNTEETRRIVVEQIRHFAPRVVILPFPVGRHPASPGTKRPAPRIAHTRSSTPSPTARIRSSRRSWWT